MSHHIQFLVSYAHFVYIKQGISWRNKAGNIKFTNNFQVSTLVKQVQSIPGVGYVLFGLSQGASGKSALVLFYHFHAGVQYEDSTLDCFI